MKLKGKLIMSAAALAACAATLTSTTYAWYTTNTEVSASGINGSSAASGDSSIFISTDKENWSQQVDLSSVIANNSTLVPVQLLGDGTYKTMAADGTQASLPNNAILKFSLYFKTAATSKDIPVYLSALNVKNTATQLNAVDNLLYNKHYAKVSSNATFDNNITYYTYTAASYPQADVTASNFADMKDTLYIIDTNNTYTKVANDATFADSITYYTYTAASYDEATDVDSVNFSNLKGNLFVEATANVGVDRNQAKYAVDIVNALGMTTKTDTTQDYGSKQAHANYLDLAGNVTSLAATNVNISETANWALNYYNEVMVTSIIKPEISNDANGLMNLTSANFTKGSYNVTICTLNADSTAAKVDFEIFLNGWDEYCFDACKNQSFTVTMSFTSDNEK